MTRYTTKHQWRMRESEEGEWVRYDEHQKLIEDYEARDLFTWGLMRKEQILTDHLETRVRALYIVLMVTYGAIVAKLIAWSLGL